jgi:hypothetical protein
MSQGNKLKFQRGAAANTEFEDRNKGAENRHHDRDGMVGPRKSPVLLGLWRFEQGQGKLPHCPRSVMNSRRLAETTNCAFPQHPKADVDSRL